MGSLNIHRIAPAVLEGMDISDEPLTVQEETSDLTENSEIEFKEWFDETTRQWVKFIREFVAIANSGGGKILLGVRDDGTPTGDPPLTLAKMDRSKITNKIEKYTGRSFSGFHVTTSDIEGAMVIAVEIDAASPPMVFTEPGQYQVDGQHRIKFRQGDVYFRHGSKSEPAKPSDLEEAIEREVKRRRNAWLEDIHKIMTAPPGSKVDVVPARMAETPGAPRGEEVTVSFVDDPDEGDYGVLRSDETHPYRTMEVVDILDEAIEDYEVTQWDVTAVKDLHDVEDDETLCIVPDHMTSPLYSQKFIRWVLEQEEQQAGFLSATKARYLDEVQS